MIGQLSIWVVYDHPSDYPNNYVARRFEGEQPTGDMMISPHLDLIREQLVERGLTCLMPMEGDDPKIMETWL